MGPKKLDREPRCIMEQFTKHKEGQLDDQDKVVLRLLPDLPSATIDVGQSGLVTGSDQPTATGEKMAIAVSE